MFTLRRIVYLLFVTCAAYAAHFVIRTPSTAWIIPVTYTLSLVTTGETFITRQTMLALMGVFLVLTSMTANFLIDNRLLLAGYLFIFILLYMRFLHHRISNTRVFVLFIFLTLLFASKMGKAESYLERTGIITLAVFIAMCSQAIFWRVLIRDNLYRAAYRAMTSLRRLNLAVFNCLLSPEYADNIFDFERALHDQKRRFFSALTMLKQLLVREPRHQLYFLTMKQIRLLEGLYENIADYAQIRWRIEDHSSFALCTEELQQLSKAVDLSIARFTSDMLMKPAPGTRPVFPLLTNALHKMESIYRHVLMVSVRDPFPLLLFIASLNGLRDKLMSEVQDE